MARVSFRERHADCRNDEKAPSKRSPRVNQISSRCGTDGLLAVRRNRIETHGTPRGRLILLRSKRECWFAMHVWPAELLLEDRGTLGSLAHWTESR